MAASTNDANKATAEAAPVDTAPGSEQTPPGPADGPEHEDGANGQQPDSRCPSRPAMARARRTEKDKKKN